MLPVCIGQLTVWGLAPHKIRSLVGCSPNASAHRLLEAGAERTLEAVRGSAVIMIEASPLSIPPWYAGLGKKATCSRGRRPQAILHHATPLFLWPRPARPPDVRLSCEPRWSTRAPPPYAGRS